MSRGDSTNSSVLEQTTSDISSGGTPLGLIALNGGRLYLPLKISVAWLAGTFILFLVVADSSGVDDFPGLTIFIGSTILCFSIGYTLKAKWLSRQLQGRSEHVNVAAPAREARSARAWLLVSATTYLVYSASLLASYGITDPVTLLDSILNPGTSYFSRLRAAEQLVRADSSSVAVQILTLMSALMAPAVPMLVLYWRKLSLAVRLYGLAGVGSYAAYWLAIGTLKGLGDLVVFAAAAWLVGSTPAWSQKAKINSKRRRYAVVGILLVFGSYMVFNQGERLTAGEISGYEPNPIAASILGAEAARGLSVTTFYVTGGYVGLSKNLTSDFEWSGMRGSSRALDSYIEQYTGSASAYNSTYPARTELRTGYPALMYWATAYPWIASDLTFPGTALFMAFVGWWLAKLWFEAAYQKRLLSMLLFIQVAIFIAYVPANNQIGLMRSGLITFCSLAAIYILSSAGTFLRRVSGWTTPPARTPHKRHPA